MLNLAHLHRPLCVLTYAQFVCKHVHELLQDGMHTVWPSEAVQGEVSKAVTDWSIDTVSPASVTQYLFHIQASTSLPSWTRLVLTVLTNLQIYIGIDTASTAQFCTTGSYSKQHQGYTNHRACWPPCRS